ncbi:hypothetical protein NL108_013041 [Boleophthalmus pectinirostris]|nr:hypothetical protein NL108_013041 [Boleophthalmus pectinirostris]
MKLRAHPSYREHRPVFPLALSQPCVDSVSSSLCVSLCKCVSHTNTPTPTHTHTHYRCMELNPPHNVPLCLMLMLSSYNVFVMKCVFLCVHLPRGCTCPGAADGKCQEPNLVQIIFYFVC